MLLSITDMVSGHTHTTSDLKWREYFFAFRFEDVSAAMVTSKVPVTIESWTSLVTWFLTQASKQCILTLH